MGRMQLPEFGAGQMQLPEFGNEALPAIPGFETGENPEMETPAAPTQRGGQNGKRRQDSHQKQENEAAPENPEGREMPEKPGYENTGIHGAAFAIYTSGTTGNPKVSCTNTAALN
ncbi:MAG: hypothetical protein K6G83_02090 [Lachnospiraceae bacterium]|nr:hypothetical protein [Lachnospiraceae bacterium]